MLAYLPGAVFLLLFAASTARDRRRFRNAVFLGLAVVLFGLGLLVDLARAVPHGRWFEALVAVVVAVPALGTLLTAGFLVANGVTVVRREGARPANLLSLLAGVGILAVAGLLMAAVAADSLVVEVVAGTVFLIVSYVSFLFLCFVGYAFLYGRMTPRRDVDTVVVLGSGLIGGDRVPPLLAGRLERGLAVRERQLRRRGRTPLLLCSGGQGGDEARPESHAMADYLTDRGVPADQVVREDRSTTTEENLRFSRAIVEELRPDGRTLVVTSNYHVFRAAMTARDVGLPAQVVGSPTAAYYWPTATLREFAAVFLAHRWVNGGICLLLAVPGVAAWLVH